jgi:excisionase family DNA binding protein
MKKARPRLLLADAPDFLTTQQTAHVLGISEALVREMLRRGDLTGLRCGRVWRVPRAALEEKAAK